MNTAFLVFVLLKAATVASFSAPFHQISFRSRLNKRGRLEAHPSPSSDLYLGIDCGTQSLKALVYDAGSKEVVAVGSQAYDINPTSVPGRAEQDPVMWAAAMVIAVNKALDKADAVRAAATSPLPFPPPFSPRFGVHAAIPAPARRCVKAIGVSGQQHGMVCLDKNLEVRGGERGGECG